MQPAQRRLVIAIDGPAGSGKSTVARLTAARLKLAHLDTGAMYRAVTAAGLREGVDPADAAAMAAIAEALPLDFTTEGLLVHGILAGPEIRTPEVDRAVSRVSAHPGVRAALVRHQRRIMEHGGFVAEGRDIGTVVYPEAPVKVFLVASIEERARRRHADLVAAGHEVDPALLAREIAERDRSDSTRNLSPLTPAADAVTLDTSTKSPDEVVDAIADLVARAEA
jgi:cytidylate kinase